MCDSIRNSQDQQEAGDDGRDCGRTASLVRQMGENIYQNVMEGVERQEALKKKREEYQQKYAHYLEHSSQTGRRMLRAFPKMQSKLHHEIWEELREKHDHLYRKK